MSLRLRLLLSFASMAVLVLAAGVVSIRESREVERLARQVLESSNEELAAATSVELALGKSLRAAREMLAAASRAAAAEPGDAAARMQSAEADFWQGLRDAERYLGAGLQATLAGLDTARRAGDQGLATGEEDEIARWITPLESGLETLAQPARDFVRWTRQDVERAERLFLDVLRPAIDEELIPLISGYRLDASAEVGSQTRQIAAQAAASTRLVRGVTLLAIGLSLALGFAAARSIAGPVTALRDAAVNFGKGDFATRVEVRARDELRDLADAFNQMIADLGSSTVSKSYLDEVIDTMTGALIVIDPERRIRSINRAGLELLGYGEGELRGRPVDLICPERDPANTGSLMRLSRDGRLRNVDRNFFHKDGTSIPVLFSGSALRDAQGGLREFVCVAYDISDRKHMEQRLRASLQEKKLLLQEVHHRVKNNLQVISSLLDLQSGYIRDPRHLDFVKDSRNRIQSMALIHEQLYRSDDLADIQIRPYFEKLTGHLFRSFGIEPGRILLRSRLDEVPIDLDRAIACGLIVNELVSNSLEHAFPGGARGEIKIELTSREPDTLRLVVGDDGRGFGDEGDPRDQGSMGLTLVETLVKQLRGRLTIRQANGIEFCIDFPRSPPDERPRERQDVWPVKVS